MTTVKLETAVRREQIAEATLAIVGSQGVRGLSIASIAQHIGLVPSAIYRHFPGKEHIIDAVLELISARLLGNVRLAEGETGDPLDCLHRLLNRHIQLIQQNEAIPRLIFSEEIFGGRPEHRTKLFKVIEGYLREVAGIVQRGQDTGVIRRDVDSHTVAIMFLGLIQPLAILWHIGGGQLDILGQVEKAWQIFRTAIEGR